MGSLHGTSRFTYSHDCELAHDAAMGRALHGLGIPLPRRSLYFSPLARASLLAQDLPSQFAASFGTPLINTSPAAPSRITPLNIVELFHRHRHLPPSSFLPARVYHCQWAGSFAGSLSARKSESSASWRDRRTRGFLAKRRSARSFPS